MALIGINRGDDLPDDCTIVIHKPAVPDARMPAHVMLEQAELLADALEKYLPALTYTALADRLGVRRGVSEKMREGRVELTVVAASADRGYDTLSCGHVATRFPVEGGKGVPLVLAGPPPCAWCNDCGHWRDLDPQQFTELRREMLGTLE